MYNTSYQILALIVPLITVPYLARVLGSEMIGIQGYVTSVASIYVNFGLLGIYSYGNREMAYRRDEKTELSNLFWELMIIRLLLLIITSFIYLFFSIRSEYSYYFIIYFIWVISNFIDTSWFFVGTENMKPAVIKNSFSKIITVLVRGKDDLMIYIMLLSLSNLIANLSLFPLLKPLINKPILKNKHN